MVDSHAYSERKVTLKSQKGNLGTEKVKLVMLMLSKDTIFDAFTYAICQNL